MIDNRVLSQLEELLSCHGDVKSLSTLDTGRAERSKCLILATMRDEESARKLNQRFGFTTFGFNSLIISSKWISSHLPDDQNPPQSSVE